VKKAQYANLNA
jgi:hypothetical protein